MSSKNVHHSLECVFHSKCCVSSWSLSPYQHTAAQPTKEIYPDSPQQDGFSRTCAQAIVFGPTTHGGIGSIDLRIEQGIMIVTEIMRTLRTPGHGQDILLRTPNPRP